MRRLIRAVYRFRDATRRRMELFVAALQPFGCVETNVYAVPSRGASGLVASGRIHAPFDFLTETIRPKVIIVHGGAIPIDPRTLILSGPAVP
jgi:hypothetical protein